MGSGASKRHQPQPNVGVNKLQPSVDTSGDQGSSPLAENGPESNLSREATSTSIASRSSHHCGPGSTLSNDQSQAQEDHSGPDSGEKQSEDGATPVGSAEKGDGDNESVVSSPDVFSDFAAAVFKNSDADQDQYLSPSEFEMVIGSPSLNLNSSPEEGQLLFSRCDVDGDGRLSLDEFTPALRELLTQAFGDARADSAENDPEWVQIGYSSGADDALPMFFNRYSGKLTYSVPDEFQALGSQESSEQAFQPEMFVRRSDGTVRVLC